MFNKEFKVFVSYMWTREISKGISESGVGNTHFTEVKYYPPTMEEIKTWGKTNSRRSRCY